jgi:hypothetical protein
VASTGSEKPEIYLVFQDDCCDWLSSGWGDNPELMRLAKEAINKGETPAEVIELLSAHFEVHT